MNDKGFQLVSLTFIETKRATEVPVWPESEHLQQDISEEELDEISELRKLVFELTEPNISLYTST